MVRFKLPVTQGNENSLFSIYICSPYFMKNVCDNSNENIRNKVSKIERWNYNDLTSDLHHKWLSVRLIKWLDWLAEAANHFRNNELLVNSESSNDLRIPVSKVPSNRVSHLYFSQAGGCGQADGRGKNYGAAGTLRFPPSPKIESLKSVNSDNNCVSIYSDGTVIVLVLGVVAGFGRPGT